MPVVLVTGAAGLVGSATARHFHALGYQVVGIDNDSRRTFFGPAASTEPVARQLEVELDGYRHLRVDIRDAGTLQRIFAELGRELVLVVHTAAQPSHDWAARDPQTDFGINATGTLNLLEACRRHAPAAVFVFTSTNKVYGDRPNRLPLVERATRFELESGHRWTHGIDETMPLDQCTHSLFGVSKLAADLMVQEYARYYGLKTGVFRGGCLTGPAHAGAQLHGFLAYLMHCCANGLGYTIQGYGGKQVRDNLHADDVAAAFEAFFRDPRPGEVYNLGGGPRNAVSVLEAIDLCERVSGRHLELRVDEEPRKGDHIWWVTDTSKLRSHYPGWRPRRTVEDILGEILEARTLTGRRTPRPRRMAGV